MTPRPERIIRYSTGDLVPIAYSKDDPDHARIDTFWFNHNGLIVGLGVALTLLATLMVRRGPASDQ